MVMCVSFLCFVCDVQVYSYRDDVVRKAPPKPTKADLPEVSQEKSKLGLGEVYAEAYAASMLGVKGPDAKQQLKVTLTACMGCMVTGCVDRMK